MNELIAMEGIDYEGDNLQRYARILTNYYYECGAKYMFQQAVLLYHLNFD